MRLHNKGKNMEIEKQTTDKSKLVLVVTVIILVGALFGAVGYLLGSKNNSTVIESENQIVEDQDNDQNIEAEEEINNDEDVKEEEIGGNDEDEKETEEVKDETSDWNVYKNEEYGFEIKYPKDIEYHSKTWGVDFVEKSEAQNKFFTIYLYSELEQLPNNEAGLSFEDWINKQIKSEAFEDGRIFSSGTLTGIKVRDQGIVPFENILIKKNDKIYSFVIRENSQFMDVFNQILSTLKSTS